MKSHIIETNILSLKQIAYLSHRLYSIQFNWVFCLLTVVPHARPCFPKQIFQVHRKILHLSQAECDKDSEEYPTSQQAH